MAGYKLYKVAKLVRGTPKSVLVNHAEHGAVDYSKATTPNVFVGAGIPNTPHLLFARLSDAVKFKGNHTDRAVYEVQAFGDIVFPEKVMDLTLGWHQNAQAFWAAVKNGTAISSRIVTQDPSQGTVALFGVINLVRKVA